MTTALDRPMFYGGMDPITMNRLETLVTNITTLQRERLNRISTIDPRRDLDQECGYPPNNLTAEEYYDLIKREPAARLVNDFFPLECWKQDPFVYETSDSDDETEWEAARKEITRQMKLEPSYLIQDKGDPINFFLLQADMLSGYGRHGIILFDLKDGKDWAEPVTPQRGMQFKGPPRAFPEHLARVNAFDMDSTSPRYGYPLSYMVTFADPYETSQSYINEPHSTVYVHWSRVIHIMDTWHTAAPSRCFAKPRVEPCRDPVLDIRKVRGGSAEMYWGGARPGTHFGTHPQLGADVDVKVDDMRDMYEEYLDGLQRALFTSGMFAEQLAPQVVSPVEQILVQMQAIALVMRTPFRILLGSERGELASGDDRKKHNGNIMSRCNTYLTSQLVGAFYDRLINYGCMPKPREGYLCEWPELESLNATEKAGNLLVRTQAYGTYTQSGMEAVVPPKEYMTKWDDMTEEEADQVLAASVDSQDGQSDTPAPLLGLVGGLTGMLEMFQKFADGAMSEETLARLIMLFYKVDEEKAYDIIAEGLPDPPEGSPRDLPPLPPMKGPGASKGPLVKNALILNWLTDNVFCPTGEGGGVDPTCDLSGAGDTHAAKAKQGSYESDPLTKREKSGVKMYVDGDGEDRMIRAILSKPDHPKRVDYIDEVGHVIPDITSALNRPLPDGINIHRGLRLSDADIGNLKPGHEYTDTSFMSTTTDKGMAESFGDGGKEGHRVLYNLTTRGAKGLDLEKHKVAYQEEREDEILLQRRSTIHISHVTRGADGVYVVTGTVTSPTLTKDDPY